MRCFQCYHEIPDDSKFCKECGAKQIIIKPINKITEANTEKKFDLEKQIQQDIKDGKPMSIIHFDKDKNVTSREDYNLENIVPDPVALKGLCRHLAKECEKFYSDPENVKKFEEWQAKRNNK